MYIPGLISLDILVVQAKLLTAENKTRKFMICNMPSFLSFSWDKNWRNLPEKFGNCEPRFLSYTE